MRYEINQDNVVEMWDDINPEPFLYQPHYPNGDSFDSKEEAEIWAKYKLEELTIAEAPEAPLGKNLPATPKPTKEEMLSKRVEGIFGVSVDELKQLLS